MSVINEHPKRLARVAAVIALLGSLIWVQWPLDLARLNIAGAVLFVAAFMAWAAIEYAEFQADGRGNKADNIMSEDASKLNRLLAMIDKRQFYILKHHAIETYIVDNNYSGLEDIIAYRRRIYSLFIELISSPIMKAFVILPRDFFMDSTDYTRAMGVAV